MSKISNKNKTRERQFMNVDHQKYLSRISKTLYYGKIPKTDRLSLPVTELAAEIFSEAQRGKSLDRLHCNEAAKVSTAACISPCSLVLAMLYLDRLKSCNPEYLERTAPSDLFLVSVMVSSKFLFEDSDEDVYMKEWAESAGISLSQLIKLERDFLDAINWRVFVSEQAFWMKLDKVEMILASKEGRSRGHYTYTELGVLLKTINLQYLFQYLSAITVLMTTAYTLGILSIIGSMFITTRIAGSALQLKVREIKESGVPLPLPIEAKPSEIEGNIALTIQDIENCKSCESCNDNYNRLPGQGRFASKNIDAVDVLKTSIFLASIKPCNDSCCGEAVDFDAGNVQNVSWDWWAVPVMTWLAKVSSVVEKIGSFVPFNYYTYLETSASTMKAFVLEDHIRKVTKTRIQDQLEGSWHVEWIDSIKRGLVDKPLAYFVANLKY